jgi:type IV pilus assembly protein PilV
MRPTDPLRRRAAQAGFTLLETLVAIVIFSIGMLGVVGLQARSIQFAVDGEDRSRAAQMADGIVAAMWGANAPSSALGATARAALAADAVAANATIYPVALQGATATVSAPDATGVVEIRITWRPPSRPASEPDSVYTTKTFIPTPL